MGILQAHMDVVGCIGLIGAFISYLSPFVQSNCMQGESEAAQ